MACLFAWDDCEEGLMACLCGWDENEEGLTAYLFASDGCGEGWMAYLFVWDVCEVVLSVSMNAVQASDYHDSCLMSGSNNPTRLCSKPTRVSNFRETQHLARKTHRSKWNP